MKSCMIDHFSNNPEAIRVVDNPKPVPGPEQILVRMLLSPINPSDFNFLRGTYHDALKRVIWNQGESDSLGYSPGQAAPLCPSPPYALGGEGVGIVEATGSGAVAKQLHGKRVAIVAGPPNGAWQEFVVSDARRAVVLPDNISDEQGAMFFINPVTAYVLAREVLRVPKGSWLLVTAAGSSLGKSVVRMGKLFGFKTICVVRSDLQSDVLHQLGADAVVETDRQDLIREVAHITQGEGVGYAMDCIGGELTEQVIRCLGLDGKLVLYGTLANAPLSLSIRDLMMPVAQISGFYLPNWMMQQKPEKLMEIVQAVEKLMADGVFDTQVSNYFPLDQVAEAAATSMQSGNMGKTMLRIGER